MIKFLRGLSFILAILISVPQQSSAQQRTCGTMSYNTQQELLHPEVKTARAERNAQIARMSNDLENAHQKGTAVVYTIPVVVHVVYNTGTQNISDAQVVSQIIALNRDYQMLNADGASVPAAFQGLRADMQIKFCLAKRDPSGLPTTGITRTSTSVVSFIDDDKVKSSATGGKNPWPSTKYLNIWVCNLPTLLGYAQFPGGLGASDGVVIHYPAFGTVGTLFSNYNLGRTATHEIGHWLGLLHTFEGGCGVNGDFVSDTPPQSVENFNCPAFPHFSCSGPANGDMFMNYMDYVNDNCMTMFSAAQKTRVQLVIGAFPTTLGQVVVSDGCNAVNNAAPNAITLTVDAGCTGSAYTNEGASQSAGEPFPSCSETSGTHTVWFKFVAPASGAVRISTDAGSSNTLSDTHLALFSTTDVNSYPAFNSIACDGDGGSSVGTTLSTLFATNLVSGQTYYVAVDGANGAIGSFCLKVDQLTSAMLSSSSCGAVYQQPAGTNSYTGWISLMDNSSNLVALVRNAAGIQASGYSVAQNINTGALRNGINGQYYLDRNFMISNAAAATTDVQLFFTNAEMAALAMGASGATLSNVTIARQPGNTCNPTFNSVNGAVSSISQSGNGSANGVSWVQFSTSGFSNFYITGGSSPLPILFGDISVSNDVTMNNIVWNTLAESGDIRYTVERSTDGKTFNVLGTVTGLGKSSRYSFLDKSPVIGTNYYRIHIIEASEHSAYSKVVKVNLFEYNPIQAFPNPISETLTVVIGDDAHNGLLIIEDLAGRVIMQTVVTSSKMNIDVHKLPTGNYVLKYKNSTTRQTVRLIKL